MVILIVHDEFGAGVVEALAAREEAAHEPIVAYRCRFEPDADEQDWLRFEGGQHWTPVATSKKEDCGRILKLLVRDVLEGASNSRVDVFFVSGVQPTGVDALRSQLVDAIRRLRSLLTGPGWVCAIVAPDMREPPGENEAGQASAIETAVDDLLDNSSFDYVFLSGPLDPSLLLKEQAERRRRRSIDNAANIAIALTCGPIADSLRRMLSFGQLDSGRRVIGLGLATLGVTDALIRTQLRAHIVRRLTGMLLERMNRPSPDNGDAERPATEDIDQQLLSSEWNLDGLRRLLSRYCETAATQEDALLRDLIRDSGNAARAMARQQTGTGHRVHVAPAAPSGGSRWIAVGSGSLALLGCALLAWQPTLIPGAYWIAVQLALLASAIVLFGFAALKRRPPEAPPLPPARDSAYDKYRQLQASLRQARVRKVRVDAWTRNITQAVQVLETASTDARSGGLTATVLSDAVAEHVLRTQGQDNLALFEMFLAQHRFAGSLLMSDDVHGTLHAIQALAGRQVSQIGSVDWLDLVALLAGNAEDDLEETWLGHIVRQLHHAATPPAYGLNSPGWELLALPARTPDRLIAKLGVVLPLRNEVVRIGDDCLMVAQATEVRFDAPASEVSPV